MYADVSFSIKLQVEGWKKVSGALLWIFKNDYLAEHVQTVASDTWDIHT